MKIVFVIALLTTIGEHKGLYTGADGKPMVFESIDACQTMLHEKKLADVNLLGTHGKCERRVQTSDGRLSLLRKGHKH